jgi:hypothetical protein
VTNRANRWYLGCALSFTFAVLIFVEFDRLNVTTWDAAHRGYAAFAVLYASFQGYVLFRSRPARWRRQRA